MSLYKAVILASQAAARSSGANDTTLGNGIDGIWYLVNEKTQTVLRGPDETQAALTGEAAGAEAARP